MASSFPQFKSLPLEIRFMIWELALPARTVIIDHNLTVATRSCIKEEVPALLSVNREARQCAEEKLTSVFQAPRLSWEYNGSLKSAELRKVLKKLGLPQRGTITIMLQTISKFMNTGDPDTTGFNRFAKYTDTSKDLAYPQWLDPKTDMLIFRFPVNDAATERISISKSLLWTPSKGNESLKIRHIAFSVDALTTHARHYEGQRVWSKLSGRSGLRDGRFLTPRKASLESVAIVISDACEVLSFRVDSKSLLKPGEWAFKLDTDNDEFKEELGARWASATWKITLAKKDDWNLMRLIREWKPAIKVWEQDKQEICFANNSVKMLWHMAERVQNFRPAAGRTAQLLIGGDGETYLGPSKPADQ